MSTSGPRVVLTSNVELALALRADISVEAEYGNTVVEGARFTAAHHQRSGPYAGRHLYNLGQPSPCNNSDIPLLGEGIILLSHIDLDSIGGALRAFGRFRTDIEGYHEGLPIGHVLSSEFGGLFSDEHCSFWDLAEEIDLSGPHRLDQMVEVDEIDKKRLYAFWAWNELPENRAPRPDIDPHTKAPRPTVFDVTALVRNAGATLEKIFRGDEVLLAEGELYKRTLDGKNRDSFRYITQSGVVVRVTKGDFVNAFYNVPDSRQMGRAVVAYNESTGSITVSLERPLPGVSARDIVQSLWGPLAGGHQGIAGSPRGREMTLEEFGEAISATSQAIQG